MEPVKIFYVKKEYLETHTGNKVSRKASVKGTQNIHLSGKCIISPGVMIRGDLAPVKIGKNTIIREDVVVRPSYKRAKGHLKYMTMHIGDYVYIGENSIICAAKIGNNVYIGKNCIISHRCVLKDNSRVEDNTILHPDTEVPPFTLYGGHPGMYKSDLPDSTIFIHTEFAQGFYNKFIAS
ncbi:hypothetical protein SteCoe_31857 [Stentor coeruleus]|uniref:Dynactin subunit 5 n=1 Tax=Stentor coeruleus TaxID=5963 RepID=A0A1R2B0D8_9CILI|nr:hypothetical protein SteCoe_31857 [Stentor coeruleus]